MYKFIFELITDPLGLPISVIWEYIILIIINEIAFELHGILHQVVDLVRRSTGQ